MTTRSDYGSLIIRVIHVTAHTGEFGPREFGLLNLAFGYP